VLSQERNVFLRTFQEKVFGLGSAEINRPLQAALVMGLSFIVGAFIPIIPYIVFSGVPALYLSGLLGGITLFGVGAFKGRLAGKAKFKSGLEFFIIAVSAAGAGYLIGIVVQHFFPGFAVPA
jgi:predicted membrane protein (TIGR00267 family)